MQGASPVAFPPGTATRPGLAINGTGGVYSGLTGLNSPSGDGSDFGVVVQGARKWYVNGSYAMIADAPVIPSSNNGTTLGAAAVRWSTLYTTDFNSAGLLATSAAAPTVASAATIAPTKQITFVSGTTTIDTITPPSPISASGGSIHLIPTGAWATSTSGNIALATTAVPNRTLMMTYDVTTTKWYPSY